MKILTSRDPQVSQILRKTIANAAEIEARVREIVEDVACRGDAAVFEYTQRFDQAELKADNFRVSTAEIEQALAFVDNDFKQALQEAVDNIRAFHARQLRSSWMEPDSEGNILGQITRPLHRVGIYVPGGTAAYPSSVLMNALPAQVAGVSQIAMVSPPAADGSMNPYTLAAASACGVTEIYKVGGAQAIAALAHGTQSVPRVDKITGPGNIYVTMAKKLVYGTVDIDMLAGPSEVLIVADHTANPRYAAADLLSQAEHDPLASAILVTPSVDLARVVQRELELQLATLSRKEIAQQSLADYGAIILTSDLGEAMEIANQFAPEHLELLLENPFVWLGQVKNAGAVFMGSYSPEPIGDYFAGPNHILPTGGTARFYSPVTVDTFTKKTSVIAYSKGGFETAAPRVIKLATVEGLDAHANSIKVRLEP
ncbi:MAG: histidinol dehydrogenase [Syntrophomonadaceae bacterium]|nr:histidinol dehydrogenase [Syntrophomonadaceae bacterium]